MQSDVVGSIAIRRSSLFGSVARVMSENKVPESKE